MPRLARILIYPVKSFDPIQVNEARVLPSGALEHDRQFALFDAEGRYINGKRTPKILSLRTTFDVASRTMTLTDSGRAFHADDDRKGLEAHLSECLGISVSLREETKGGFPDDTDSPGPTVISTATLTEVAGWFHGISLDEARRRFRANLEIEADEPFWEDRLYGNEGTTVRFRIGKVEFLGNNPCARCAVPTRSSLTGERTPEFTATFEKQRSETLPPWATPARFDHFYRLAVNTRPGSTTGGRIAVGDEVAIL